MNIAVYLGSNFGNDPIFKVKIIELGEFIGKNHHTLVYGGSKNGLMGLVAESTLKSGGNAIGVETTFFMDEKVNFEGLTKLYVTNTMAERKTKMIELSNAFIAFPGGVGTLEEISEIMCKESLKHLDSPCIIYNLNGYYNPLKELLDNMLKFEFSTEEKFKNIHFCNNIDEIKEIIETYSKKSLD